MENPKEFLPLEELKILQDIASRQEELRVKIRGWCIALLTALSVAALSQEIRISSGQFFFFGCVILVLFLWLDALYRVAQDRAFDRAKVVESVLRGEVNYDGPRIRDSLSEPNSLEGQIKSLRNVRVYSPYAILLIIVTIVALVAK